MKTKTFWLLVLFTVASLALIGCNKGEKASIEESEEVINPVVEEPLMDVNSSLTSEDLDSMDKIEFPVSYSFSTYNWDDELIDEWEFTYPEDIDHSLLIPELATMASRELVSSNTQDWMIYTFTKVTLQDWTVLDVLYINNPETLRYIAASVRWEDKTVNYEFSY